MRANLFLLCILFFVNASFSRSEEEERLQQLHQTGELALKKHDYALAQECFEALLKKANPTSTQKYQVDFATYVDVVVRLATTYQHLENFAKAHQILTATLKRNPPQHLRAQLQFKLAQIENAQGNASKAFAILKQVENSFPIHLWTGTDLSFFHALEYNLDIQFETLLHKAKCFLTAGLYNEAMDLYQKILLHIENGEYPKAENKSSFIYKKVAYKLLESRILSQPPTLTETTDYFTQKQIYEKQLLNLDPSELADFDRDLFDTGYVYYKNHHYSDAKPYFEKMRTLLTKPSFVASIYLARIYLQQTPEMVESLLQPVTQAVHISDPLHLKAIYLRGLAAYSLKDYLYARELLEESLPSNTFLGGWQADALYHLGWCYLHLSGEDKTRTFCLEKAEDIFNKLLRAEKKEEGCRLALSVIDPIKYLSPAQEKSIEIDTHCFNIAQTLFADYIFQNPHPDPRIVESYYRTWLQDGKLSELSLCTLVDELLEKNHPLSSLLKQKTTYPPLLEEAEYALAKLYLVQKKDAAAQAHYINLLLHASQAGINASEILSQAWRELSQLALKQEDYKTATLCADFANQKSASNTMR